RAPQAPQHLPRSLEAFRLEARFEDIERGHRPPRADAKLVDVLRVLGPGFDRQRQVVCDHAEADLERQPGCLGNRRIRGETRNPFSLSHVSIVENHDLPNAYNSTRDYLLSPLTPIRLARS